MKDQERAALHGRLERQKQHILNLEAEIAKHGRLIKAMEQTRADGTCPLCFQRVVFKKATVFELVERFDGLRVR